MQNVALLIIHVYIVIGRSEMGDVRMCRITDTCIYWSPATVYADDNSYNMYCRRRQFLQATLYAVTALLMLYLTMIKKASMINIADMRKVKVDGQFAWELNLI